MLDSSLTQSDESAAAGSVRRCTQRTRGDQRGTVWRPGNLERIRWTYNKSYLFPAIPASWGLLRKRRMCVTPRSEPR